MTGIIRATLATFGFAVAIGAVAFTAPSASAEVVFCKHVSKNKIKTRESSCRGKETQVAGLGAILEQLAELGGRMDELETGSTDAALGARVTSLESSVGGLGGEVAEVQERVGTLPTVRVLSGFADAESLAFGENRPLRIDGDQDSIQFSTEGSRTDAVITFSAECNGTAADTASSNVHFEIDGQPVVDPELFILAFCSGVGTWESNSYSLVASDLAPGPHVLEVIGTFASGDAGQRAHFDEISVVVQLLDHP